MDEIDFCFDQQNKIKTEAVQEALDFFDQTKGKIRGFEEGRTLGNELYYYKSFCQCPLEKLASVSSSQAQSY